MVKFSCLYSHILLIKPKKTMECSDETMHKTLEGCFQSETKSSQGYLLDEFCSKSEGNNSNHSSQQENGVRRSGNIRKSISLGSGLGREERDSVGSGSENEKRENYDGTIAPVGVEHLASSSSNQSQEALPSDSENKESLFFIGDTPHLSKDDCGISDLYFSHEGAGVSNDGTRISPPSILKSKSLHNICLSPQNLVLHSRSAEDLTALDVKRTEMDSNIFNKEENVDVKPTKGGCDSYEHVGSGKDWTVPVIDEIYSDKHCHGESSSFAFEEMPSKDYKTKRIEDWVSDLQHYSSLEETNDDLSYADDIQILGGGAVVDNPISAKFCDKLNPGVEVAKRYISSLSPIATTANLANHGLVVVPLLGAFVSLRTLNLSGNFIVKITAGTLPRGLHVLNLSRNSITTIEGLRELTRLRVLDLSYNRIVRIGHGLASCSSLKELYLAGNKISEVEGLHRLLKLNVLDLRFNKISTAKSLGQLAANYNSLQAISLEGNPAQKNVGDENLKKYVQGLLPQLAYYNRHSIKTKSLSDNSDRSARLGITSSRGVRSDHKTLRKANHGGSAHNKPLASSVRGSRNQSVLPKPSKGKAARLPPTGSKAVTSHRNHFYDFGSKILGFGSDHLIRKSRSEGTLAAM